MLDKMGGWELQADSFERDVAQSGSAPEWGSGGRRFKSSHPDQDFQEIWAVSKSC